MSLCLLLLRLPRDSNIPYPEGPTYTTIMELGPKNQNRDVFLGPNSIGSVYGPSGLIKEYT